MKIVCEACQAKYSIADEKVRGKVFKIRCKKCGHVIVVRGSGEVATGSGQSSEFAAAPASSADIALDAGWHIVVDGEQVGPLSEADVRARLSRAEITSDTYIWREGLSDWVKISTLPEFAEGEGVGPFAGTRAAEESAFESDGPTAVAQSGHEAVFGAGPAEDGVPPIAELFAAPLPGADSAVTSVSGPASFSPYEPSASAESYSRSGGNGSLGAVQGSSLTGQRHENSVLFSLANLEALAKPSSPLAPPRSSGAAPSSSTTTEGSGLIDIRAMANMTLGASARSDSKSDDLPAFSAPQFSPVAPVLLPMGSSGTPRWAIVVLSVLGLAIVALGVVVVKMFTASPPAASLAVAPPPVAAPAPTPVAVAPSEPSSKEPPTTPPPAPNEALPPREPGAGKPPATEGATAERPTTPRPGRGAVRRGQTGSGRNQTAGALERPAGVPSTPPAPSRPKPKDDIEALLEAASGNRRAPPPAAAARREEEDAPARGGEKAPPLERDEIVRGMNAVMPRARDCYTQFKVPGVATVKITVNPTGRVSVATVTGRFAGTPSGTCVENALKTARFPPSAGRAFDYVVPLR